MQKCLSPALRDRQPRTQQDFYEQYNRFSPPFIIQHLCRKRSQVRRCLSGSQPTSDRFDIIFSKKCRGHRVSRRTPKNYKALSLVLGAFGLQGSINDTAILRQLMTQNPSSPGSLAQSLGNAKYQVFARALSNWDTPPFANAASRTQLIASFTTNTFEQTADTQASGLANALYFTREAHSLKTQAAVQSDAGLLAVAVTSLGLPLQNFEQLDFDQQSAILKSNLNVASLQNPSIVKRMTEQYLIAQQSTANDQPAAGSLASLYSDDADTTGDAVLTILAPSSDVGGSSGSGAGVLSLFA